jgi:oligopeptide transport system ATP-binding protein
MTAATNTLSTDHDVILSVDDITKTFAVAGGTARRGRLTALDAVSLQIRRGETLAIVGESGCGKSTLARTLLMLERPDSGTIRFSGVDPFGLRKKELLDWRRRVQMVFQDPFASLNPRMTTAEIISEPWKSHPGLLPKEQRAARIRELLGLVGLRPTDASRYPSEFSGGQRQRIGIARALALEPEILVLDEPVSALDLSVQAQVINLLNDLQERLNVAYVFISHDLSVVRHVADKVAVMYLGKVVEFGAARAVFADPQHPYTASLLSAVPKITAHGTAKSDRIILKGEIPSPLNPPSGCRFRTRCWRAEDVCAATPPPITPKDASHYARCHFPLVPV